MSQIELNTTKQEGTVVELAEDELHPQNVQFFEALDEKMMSLSCVNRREVLSHYLDRAHESLVKYYTSEEELINSDDLQGEAFNQSLQYIRVGRRLVEERAIGLLYRYNQIEERIQRRQQKIAESALAGS